MPDLFASGPEAFPRTMEPWQAFNLRMARGSGRNVDGSVPWRDALSLVGTLPSLGIRPRTALDLAQQIVDERRNKWKTCRRRTYQSVLAFDVFMRQLHSTKPQLATFFTNHVASAMHRYWGAMFPEHYQYSRFDAEWSQTFGGEILFAMDKLNDMVRLLVRWAEATSDATLLFASSMGQEAVESSLIETQAYVTDPARFMAWMGVPEGAWQLQPAMLPQFNLLVAPPVRYAFMQAVAGLKVGEQSVAHRIGPDGFFSLDFGQANLAAEARIERPGSSAPIREAGLTNVTIDDRSGTTAYHVHPGSLIVFDGKCPSDERSEISTLDLALSIIAMLGASVPPYMRRPIKL